MNNRAEGGQAFPYGTGDTSNVTGGTSNVTGGTSNVTGDTNIITEDTRKVTDHLANLRVSSSTNESPLRGPTLDSTLTSDSIRLHNSNKSNSTRESSHSTCTTPDLKSTSIPTSLANSTSIPESTPPINNSIFTSTSTEPTSNNQLYNAEVIHNFDEQQWMLVSRNLDFQIPDNPLAADAWRSLALKLHNEVERWEDRENQSYKPNHWDFCVIHSADEEATYIACNFVHFMQSLGFFGRSISDIQEGDTRLEETERMIEGSTRVFVLITSNISQGLPKKTYQEIIMQKLRRPQWHRKLIPLFPPPATNPRITFPPSTPGSTSSRCSSTYPTTFTPRNTLGCVTPIPVPMFLANLHPHHLGDDIRTADMAHRNITTEDQGWVQRFRRQELESHRARIRRHRQRAFKQLTEKLNNLKQMYADCYDPSDMLDQVTFHLDTLDSYQDTSPYSDSQVVSVSNSTAVSIGPSFHFNITQPRSTY